MLMNMQMRAEQRAESVHIGLFRVRVVIDRRLKAASGTETVCEFVNLLNTPNTFIFFNVLRTMFDFCRKVALLLFFFYVTFMKMFFPI